MEYYFILVGNTVTEEQMLIMMKKSHYLLPSLKFIVSNSAMYTTVTRKSFRNREIVTPYFINTTTGGNKSSRW